jgi:ankyrin repeat protein
MWFFKAFIANKYHHSMFIQENQEQVNLFDATAEGNKNVIKKHLSKNTDLTLIDSNGHTLLHISCIHGNFELTKYILEFYRKNSKKGKEDLLNIRDKEGRTPLHCACNSTSKNPKEEVCYFFFDFQNYDILA